MQDTKFKILVVEDEEEVEENLRIILLTIPFFSVEEEKRFTILFVFVLEVFSDLVLFEEEGSLLVTAERLGVERFSLEEEDLNRDGTTLVP